MANNTLCMSIQLQIYSHSVQCNIGDASLRYGTWRCLAPLLMNHSKDTHQESHSIIVILAVVNNVHIVMLRATQKVSIYVYNNECFYICIFVPYALHYCSSDCDKMFVGVVVPTTAKVSFSTNASQPKRNRP